MSFRQKIFIILGASQLLLVLILAFTFIQMIDRVKNEPQNKRALDRAFEFRKELQHKDEVIRLLLKEIERNQKTRSILESGLNNNRPLLLANFDYIKGIMAQYDLSIFELLDTKGVVFFRFHRPKDFGDDKSKQKIVQEALQGGGASTLEIGHSGLGLRITAPLRGGLMLVGQVVNEKFLKSIVGSEDVHMAIFEKGKLVASSDTLIAKYLEQKTLASLNDGTRLKFEDKHLYLTKIPYEGLSNLKLEFVLMIDETDLYESTRNLWIYCGLIALFVFGGILITSYFFSRDIIHAVKALNFAMKNPAEDESKIVDLERSDELGEMAEVFVGMKKDLLDHQLFLEKKVEEKTHELQETLTDLRALKEKQDGDYYLTSLLLRPLATLDYNGPSTKIQSILRQKKTFTFRKRDSDIGGDLVSISEITLYGKKYLVLMNSDAMGKSIQGAGGALVMGTVFKAILTRTQLSRTNQRKTPEKWLKDCYTELQNVFVTFDGTMLVSALICLLDEETGALYSLNAEHPNMVLYRDGKATFLDPELALRKLGFSENSTEPLVRVYKLEKGDVVFIGSDGRDDILITDPNKEEPSMNEDEFLFLRFVELANGNLQDLERLISAAGEISDDLSLMRVGFKEATVPSEPKIVPEEYNQLLQEGIREYKKGSYEKTKALFKKALTLDDSDPALHKQLARICINAKDYEEGASYCEAYLSKVPFDNEYIFYTSYCLRKTKDYWKSLEYSEKLRSREPENVRNLKHLVALYRLTGSRTKFRTTIAVLKQIVSRKDPERSDSTEPALV
ncbi:SpoIIE-like protein phosphatase domain protein [Leptospira broomii serovar Hurstbridge str. 5399]|uniref:SpoIIE-like protein phosphatase domain protein n=1 Tax=Leptospira broomii serovar Hurstbridge str. 5399 TaxID=1049789 RepID=T0GLU9_9LEPT|nr:SpoIIE family protein phosphatase [Leptospira broomii]EQA46343.1 SpoIIE-like protein phosphatase domain protein [Leptospira broomii serovar Hurstbridge str. 5399]